MTRFCTILLLVAEMVTPLLAENTMTVTSTNFDEGKPIPGRFSYHAENHSPALTFIKPPQGTQSLALIVDDPDAPVGLWTHWLLWNIPVSIHSIREYTLPSSALQGRNSFGNSRYDGPAPPSGTHRYFFHVYALDTVLTLPSGASRGQLEAAMKDHVLGGAEMYGTFSASP